MKPNMNDPIFVDFNTVSFKDWSQTHYDHKKKYQENEDEGRIFRWVVCQDCKQMYFLGEYTT